MARGGFEPPTLRFSVACLPTELPSRTFGTSKLTFVGGGRPSMLEGRLGCDAASTIDPESYHIPSTGQGRGATGRSGGAVCEAHGRCATCAAGDFCASAGASAGAWAVSAGSGGGSITIRRMIVVLMGVAGSGKTTVGQALRSGWAGRFLMPMLFIRRPTWTRCAPGAVERCRPRARLEAMHQHLQALLASKGESAAARLLMLKDRYRRRLGEGLSETRRVYLHVSRDICRMRLRQRAGHFMPAELIDSQFETLEEPTDWRWWWMGKRTWRRWWKR